MYIEQKTPVVIDNGSGMFKAGLSGYDAPFIGFPSIVGRPKYQNSMRAIVNKDAYVGQEASVKRGVLNLSYPMEHGIINNWDDMTKIWQHCFYNQLRITPFQHPCLLTQRNGNPKAKRQKITEIMFETFDVPKFYLAKQTILSLYASGKTAGLVLNCGDGVTQVTPIYEGYIIPLQVQKLLNTAGRELTNYMKNLLNNIGLNYTTSAEIQTIREIKEKHGYVALDFDEELKNYRKGNKKQIVYQLPDGNEITLGSQRFICPEALFKPYMIGDETAGIHEMVHQSIKGCDLEIRKDLYNNILITGGSTYFPGFPERLSKEVTALAPSNAKIKISACLERKFLTWIGGSILCMLSTFQEKWITKAEYQERGGPSIIHKKCP